MRLAAMSLHGMLGAATSAIDSFDALDIKHIQHDTLSGKCLCNDPKCTIVAFYPCWFHTPLWQAVSFLHALCDTLESYCSLKHVIHAPCRWLCEECTEMPGDCRASGAARHAGNALRGGRCAPHGGCQSAV